MVGELRFHMPGGQKTKTYNRSNIVANSITALKMVHIKQIFKAKKKREREKGHGVGGGWPQR